MKKFLFLILLLASFPALASQNSTTLPTTSPYAGLTMLNNINSAFDTFQSNFSGATAPSIVKSYQWWIDTTTETLKFYDGGDWLPVAKYAGGEWVPISNGVIGTIPGSTGSANAYVVTYSPAPTELVTGQHYPFISNFQNTSAATLNVNGLGAYAITKRGSVSLAAADIPSGAVVDTVWDGTRFQMLSQLGNASSGTVTSIATNNGITGGTITASGTIGLATQADGTILSNISGSTSAPTGNSASGVLDSVFSSTQGSVLYRGASSWSALTPGTNGQVLTTQGSSANPVWASPSSGAVAQYDTFTSNGTWTKPSGVTTNSLTRLECVGGGGASGSGGDTNGGYGGSAFSAYFLTSCLPSSISVTIGSGGAPSRGNGGNSSFGTYLVAYGGGVSFTVGGTYSGCSFIIPGTSEIGGFFGNPGYSSVYAGAGGGNYNGGACASGGVSAFGGAGGNGGSCYVAASVPGGGGGRGAAGGSGAAGICRAITWY